MRNLAIAHWLKLIAPFFVLAVFTLAARNEQLTISNEQLVINNYQNSPNSINSLNSTNSLTATPRIEAIVNLGVPVGNTHTPKHLALDSQAGRLYILGEGVPILKQGNGLGVYDIEKEEFIGHIKINQGDNRAIDLQVDPTSGLVYALWNQQYSDTRPTLTVINGKPLEPEQDIPGVEAFTVSDGQLYAANAEELLSVNLSNNSLDEAQSVELTPADVTGPMAVSPTTNRLYLARQVDGQWSMEIFEADTLTPVGSYFSDTKILNIIPLPDEDQVLIVATLDSFKALYRVTSDGELADLPYEMGPQYGATGVALSQDGERFYYSNGESSPAQPSPDDPTGPALIGVSSSPDLSPLASIPLPTNFDALAVNDVTNQAFALYPFDHYLYEVDLNQESFKIVNTAIHPKDVLVDNQSNQIFVSDTANRVRRLDAESLEVLAEIQLQGNGADYGFKSSSWAGELALDKDRNQLYISGLPAVVVEADTLEEIGAIEPGGQLAPDPTGDNIYVSNCGITIINADTFSGDTVIPGSGQRPDGLSPNPCVGYSKLDAQNQRLYSLVPNGVPGSNSGNHFYVYDLSVEPTVVFSDFNISTIRVEPEPADARAFTSFARHSNLRIRALDHTDTYAAHLMGVWGDIRYNPETNRLYLGDRNHDRLLTLDADTLSVVDALALPTNYNYRLAGIDQNADRLYFIGYDGQLLIASADETATAQELSLSPAREPTGKIMALESTSSGDILARIESKYDTIFDTRLYRTTNEGKTWTDLGQNLPSMPVQALAVSENNDDTLTLFVGLQALGQTGALYTSTDGGETWAPAMAGLQDLWVDNLYISPDFAETGLIMVKTSHGGLHQSTDGGASWIPLQSLDPNAQFPASSTNAAAAFDGQGTVLAAQSLEEATGIYQAILRSNGTLSEWKKVFDQPVSLVAYSPDGGVALAFGSGLWRSADGGTSWQAGGAGLIGVENLQPDRILFSPDFETDDTVYFFFKDLSGSIPAILFRSTDGGDTWQPWVDPDSGGNSFTAVTLSPNGDFIFGDANTQLTRLAPADLPWADPAVSITPFPIHSLSVAPNFDADQTLFALSSEYGLYKSTNGGQNWQLTSFPARNYRVITPNPYQVVISPGYAQDQTLYVATGRSLHRSTDGGETWTQLGQLQAGAGKTSDQLFSFPVRRVAVSPKFDIDQTVLANTGQAVYRSTDGGDTWEAVLTPEQESSISDVLTFTPGGDVAYARFGYGSTLFVSDDSGQSWQTQPSVTRDEYLSLIDSSTDSGNALIGALEFDKRLLQTDPQTPPWRETNESLPAELTTLTAVTHSPNDTLFIGGQGGVFSSTDNGQNWNSLNANLPPDANVTRLCATDTNLFAVLSNGEIFDSAGEGSLWENISIVK